MASVAAVQISVDTESDTSGVIDARFFGGNLLFDRDDLSGTFEEKVADLNLKLLRFPGGGMAEDKFDVTNPDATGVFGMEGHETLTNFLTFCAANGLTPSIVIPTKRYVDDVATGVADVSAFVAAVTAGTYGPVTEVIFEIGNEFYANTAVHDGITSYEYGAIASQFAVAIENASLVPATIAVQAGRTQAQNENIISTFDTAQEKGAISGVVIHQYPWTAEAVEARFIKSKARLDEWEDAGVVALSFMSEWNIGSSPITADDPLHDYGLPQSAALLEIMHHAVYQGIDYSAIWGLQHTTKTALGRMEGTSQLLAAGMMFQMASDVLPGKTAFMDAISYSTDDLSVAYAYEDDAEFVVFVAAQDFDEVSGPLVVSIDLLGDNAEFVSVTGQKLSSDDPLLEPRPDGVSSIVTPELVFGGGQASTLVSFDKDYEVIRLRFAKPETVLVATDQDGSSNGDYIAGGVANDNMRGHKGHDFLAGHDGADVLLGGGGHDQISGGAGNDTLTGGSGADTLSGGAGNDLLNGQNGRDELRGGSANDTIKGGAGRDFLYGDDGHDVLEGGSGTDRLWGGAGADTFVFASGFGIDRVFGFENGIDVLDMTLISSVSNYSDLTGLIVVQPKEVHINLVEGSIKLRDFDIALLDATDFLF